MEENKSDKEDSDNNQIINNRYKIISKIGHGGFGKVYLVEDKTDGKNYALKVLIPGKSPLSDIKTFMRETEILSNLGEKNNSYILKLYGKGTFQGEDKKEHHYLVVDYVEKGDLYHFVKINNGLGEQFGKIMFKKIVEGIKFCHGSNYCHLDIKVSNILLDERFNPIINDFGLSKRMIKNMCWTRGIRGTRYAMCPQMLEGKIYNAVDADIFALGALLFELIFNKRPFEKKKEKEDKKQEEEDLYKYIKDKNYGAFWNKYNDINEKHKISQKFKDLFVKLVAYDPKERLSIEYILKDPWFEEINISKEKNPEEYKNLENEFYDFMKGIENKIKSKNEMSIQPPKKEEKDEEKTTKSVSFTKETIYFNDSLVPKKLKDKKEKRIFKYCVKIKGYINAVKFMNSLMNKIIKNLGNGFYIKAVKDKLKIQITYEEEEENEEKIEQSNEFEGNKENQEGAEDQEIEEVEDENDRNNFVMVLKLFESDKNEYLLSFDKRQGDLKGFYDTFLIIENIIKKMFE